MCNNIKIDYKNINSKSSTLIIAELSANHGQDIDIAKKTIKAAKKAGADAIKLQTYTADTITLDCNNKYFQIKQGTIWDGTTLYKLYNEAYTPWEWHKELMEVAKQEGIICFSSPFDKSAVDFLENIRVPAYKIASFEITDIPLIEYVASKGKPVIISTGIATLSDIEEAVNACRRMGNNQIALLKCTSSYPAPIEESNLRTIPNIKETFNVVSGLSDHTLGSIVATTAVALGAKIIEKHFILSREIGGPDAAFSMEPHEFKQMVDDIRIVEKALGKVTYDLTEKQRNSRQHSRSLFVVKDIKEGEMFTEDNVKSIRPGFGLKTKYINNILGKKAKKSIAKGTPVDWNMI
ncbi:pseudaminic acid synthase [Clostridium tetani]|uniref:pseudaminic acid synthase n=1 Tax=Clostridium tetani TaxID=1513 RepID=UPI00100AABB1|nr:pseudaminic acid synthase [Clostridium tetani]RXI45895.1 pseudaminic acid synthase [Clostridium tetani]RXM61287.1 pseudaminic acid synthase [Clostridium tetani]RXM70112.1 pseudaminic acid synthase [Clostridium tetani]